MGWLAFEEEKSCGHENEADIAKGDNERMQIEEN